MYADIAAVVPGVLDDRRPFFATQETVLQSSSAAGLLHAATLHDLQDLGDLSTVRYTSIEWMKENNKIFLYSCVSGR